MHLNVKIDYWDIFLDPASQKEKKISLHTHVNTHTHTKCTFSHSINYQLF